MLLGELWGPHVYYVVNLQCLKCPAPHLGAGGTYLTRRKEEMCKAAPMGDDDYDDAMHAEERGK